MATTISCGGEAGRTVINIQVDNIIEIDVVNTSSELPREVKSELLWFIKKSTILVRFKFDIDSKSSQK